MYMYLYQIRFDFFFFDKPLIEVELWNDMFAVMAASAVNRMDAERKLRISRNCNIAGVVLGLILTPIIIWYQVNRYQQLQEEQESHYYH